jgi:hypothetical protein
MQCGAGQWEVMDMQHFDIMLLYPGTYRTSETGMWPLHGHDDIPKSKLNVIRAGKYSGDCNILNHFVLRLLRPPQAKQVHSEACRQKRKAFFPYPHVSGVRGV